MITSDNKYIVSGSGDKSIKIFDVATKQQVYHFIDAHEGRIRSIALSSDNKYLFSGSTDCSIKVFDLQTKQQVHHFQQAHAGNFHRLNKNLSLSN